MYRTYINTMSNDKKVTTRGRRLQLHFVNLFLETLVRPSKRLPKLTEAKGKVEAVLNTKHNGLTIHVDADMFHNYYKLWY